MRTKFCQFVSSKNRVERIVFAQLCLTNNYSFSECIFIDECTIQANRNAKRVWYKFTANETRLGLVPKYTHEYQLHVLGGISRRGRTELMIFTGYLNAAGFIVLLREFFLPFVETHYPDGHCLNMDNAPWHKAGETQAFIANNGISYHPTPAQSPDFNPIELVWNDMKDFIRTEIKPATKNELIAGIHVFWNRVVTVAYCNSKINHLERVLPRAIELNGKPTGM